MVFRTAVAFLIILVAGPNGELRASHWEVASLLGLAILLVVGLGTPYVCVMGAIIEASSLWEATTGALRAHIVAEVAMTACLAILGPGAFSVDARIYGRKLIVPEMD